MKTLPDSKTPRRAADWLLPAFCVFCAAGAAVTGTMLLMENREEQDAPMVSQSPPDSTAKDAAPNAPATGAAPFADALPQSAPAGAAPNANAPDAHQHGPPPSTAGMQPAQAALLMANWHYDVAHWNDAIEKYQEAISLGLDNPDVRTDLGNCYRFSAQPQKALEQYRLAQKQNPQHENSLFNQGGLFASELKQPERGVAIWKEYLRRFPTGQNVPQSRKLIARYEK